MMLCPGGTVSTKWRWQQGDGSGNVWVAAMQISSLGPAAAGRLRPPLHLRGDESRGLLGMCSERWTEPELAAIRPLEIIINLTGCGTRTPSVCTYTGPSLGIAIKMLAWDGHG